MATLDERLIGADPDAWKGFFPTYEPNDDVRVAKARAISQGQGPQVRAELAQSPRQAAFQLTPLSDEDVELARSVGLDLGDIREVPGLIKESAGTFASLAEADAALNTNSQTSSGQIVEQDQNARAEDSNTQNPEPEIPEESESDLEDGIRRREAREAREEESESQDVGRTDALSQAGIGIRDQTPLGNEPQPVSDDEGNESAEDFEEEVDPDVILENTTIPGEFTTRLVPKPNILSEFSSYSYSISIYLMRPDDYRNMMLTGEKRLFGSTLLIQTGGVSGTSGANRNQFFNDDFYIDNLDIESLVTGKVNQGAHNATLIRFNITEPYGISFLDRLRDAVNDFRGSDQNLLSQVYLMVIRFYGYDEAGNLVRPENKAEETTDSNSVVEKFIPFIWESIKFTVANQLVNYECKAVAVNQYVGLGQLYTSIPYNIEISGQSLSEVVNGEAIFSDSEPTPDQTEASESDGETEAQSTKTIKQGLVAALNKFEREKAEETGSIPNEYAIKLDESVGLSNAKMAQFNEAYLANLPMDGRTNATLAQQTKTDNNQRKYSLIAGQPIVQVLDLLVRASTYITDQQLVKFTEDPAVDRGGAQQNKKYARIRDGSQGPVAWYKITTHIEPKEYDKRRNEHSYKMTFIVSGYQINDLKSEFFPETLFRGVHKEYDYWFTGENTEVLNFEQEFNSLFYLSMAPQDVLIASGINPRQRRNDAKRTTLDTTDASEVMGTGEQARPAADAASALYSPADQGTAELEIIGDPAWIQQSELLYSNIEGINYAPFLPDDSINYDSQEPLFQISFNLPTDYDVENTGTMPVRKFNQVRRDEPGSHRFVYRANRITNSFNGGVFTQQISATQMFDTFPKTSDTRNGEDTPDLEDTTNARNGTGTSQSIVGDEAGSDSVSIVGDRVNARPPFPGGPLPDTTVDD